jgi:dolichyl-phosphate beta-glucosyltransferase
LEALSTASTPRPPTTPFLSVVVPTFNEAAGITSCLQELRDTLPAIVPSWEIVVADDGSTDATRAIVGAVAALDPRVRLLAMPHRGKGATVRDGLLAANGSWRFMADADLSTPPQDIVRFLDTVRAHPQTALSIGSREAPGAERIGEPLPRYLIGRAFNAFVRLAALPGIRDTQCGFKLLSADAVRRLCPQIRAEGFAFDVELLFLARRAGLTIREVGVVWRCRRDTRVAVRRGAAAFGEVLRIRTRAWRGDYEPRSASPAIAER